MCELNQTFPFNSSTQYNTLSRQNKPSTQDVEQGSRMQVKSRCPAGIQRCQRNSGHPGWLRVLSGRCVLFSGQKQCRKGLNSPDEATRTSCVSYLQRTIRLCFLATRLSNKQLIKFKTPQNSVLKFR